MKKTDMQVPEQLREKQQEIRKEDKKSLPKLLLFMLCAAIIGFPIGFGMGYLGKNGIDWLPETLEQFWKISALWMIPVFALLLALPSLLLCTGMKKAISQLGEEDDAAFGRIDSRLGVSMLLSAAFTICVFFGLAVILSVCDGMSGAQLLTGLAELIAGLTLATIAQKKAVDLTKLLYPEICGSVFDTRFIKTWEESCDEREKSMIWQSGYRAYRTTSAVYPLLFAIIAVGAIPFRYGPLPAGIVLLMWLIQTMSYCIHAIGIESRTKKGHTEG